MGSLSKGEAFTVNSPDRAVKSIVPKDLGGNVKDCLDLTDRVADSPEFRRAPRLRELFLHLCRHGLAGKEELLTEQRIGVDLFQRDAAYNPSEDNIVRAQVRLLRRKLELYFEQQGAGEPLVITIPKGGYLPSFTPRATEPIPPSEPLPLPAPAESAQPANSSPWRLVLAAALLLAIGWLAGRFFPGTNADTPARPLSPVLAKLAVPNEPLLVVVQDASLTLIQNLIGEQFPIDEIQNGTYRNRLASPEIDPALVRALKMIDGRQYTSMGDVGILKNLWKTPRQIRDSLQIANPRHLHLRQLKESNAILIGGPISNPWSGVFDSRLDFVLTRNAATRLLEIENRHPRPGEPARFSPNDGAYAILALLPNYDQGKKVLLLEGTSLEGTEAAADMALSPSLVAILTERIRQESNSPDLVDFQAVIRTKKVGGTSSSAEIAALRVFPAKP